MVLEACGLQPYSYGFSWAMGIIILCSIESDESMCDEKETTYMHVWSYAYMYLCMYANLNKNAHAKNS